MKTRSRESSTPGTRKSGRTRQKRSLGQDYVDPEEFSMEEVVSEPSAKRKKSVSNSPAPTANQQLDEMVASAIAAKEIKQEEDFIKAKPSPVQKGTQKKWTKPEVRRSARQVRPSAKALECDKEAMKEIKAEVEEDERDSSPDVEYYPPVPNMPAPSSSFSAQNLVARCPSKITVNHRLRKPVMYTGIPDLCEKRKPIKPTGPKAARPINRLKQKTCNLSMTPIDGIFANGEPLSPETEERLSQEAEEAVAQIRAASVQKILEKRSRGKFSSGGQAARQNKEIERFVYNSVDPEKAIQQLAESLSKKDPLPLPKQQPRPFIVKSKQPQFVREGNRTVVVPPNKKQMTVANHHLIKTVRIPNSRLVPVSRPLRLAIAPKHRLPMDTQLRIPKEEIDFEKDEASKEEMQLIDPKVEALEDPFFEKKPETIEPKEQVIREVPGVKRQGTQFSQLAMRMDRETGKLYVPYSSSLPGAPSVVIGAGPTPKYYALKSTSQLRTPKPKGSQITTRIVTVDPRMEYRNKDGSAPGPSNASDDLPPSLPPNPVMSNRQLRKIIAEQTMMKDLPTKAVPVNSPQFASPPKPISTPQPVRKLLIDPKTAKILQQTMMKRDADGKPMPTRPFVGTQPPKVAGNVTQLPVKPTTPQKTSAASRESDNRHNKWNPEYDHAYCKPFSKKPMSPDRIISKTYVPPAPTANPIMKYLGNRDRELRTVTANDNLHPLQPQFVDSETIEQKPTGLIEEGIKDIKREVDDEDIVEIPAPEVERKPTDLLPNFEPRRMVMLFHPPATNLQETEKGEEYEEEEEPERTPSPERVFLGAQEPMKDLDEDAYKFNRVTIKYCKSFTAKQLRPFGKRPPGQADKPAGPGLSVCLVEEDDDEEYQKQKEMEEEEEKRERDEKLAKIEAEKIRQKEALAQRLTKNEGKIWKYMMSDGFKKLQKPEDQMGPFEKIMLQHDALAKIPAYSETLSRSNPKLFKNLQRALDTLVAHKRNAPLSGREHKQKERHPQVLGRVSGPVQVNLHDAKEEEKVNRQPISNKEREPKLLTVLWNDVSQQVPDTITCHLCDHKMRLCMRKSNYRGELREYPAYRCLRKGCQTFRSIKKFIEGTPVYVTKKKNQPLIESLHDPLAKFVPSSREEFESRKANIEMNLRPRLPSKIAKLLEEYVADESAADITRKDLEAEDSHEEDELTAKTAQQDYELEYSPDEDDELVGWAQYPGVASNSTPSDSVASPSYERLDEEVRMEMDEDSFLENYGVEEEDYDPYMSMRSTEQYRLEDYVEEEPMEALPQATMKEPKEEPIEYDNVFDAPMVKEIKEEVIDEAFEEMLVVQEKKPEFLLHTSKVNS